MLEYIPARTRQDWKVLASLRLKEAEALYESGFFSGAAYLAGYSLECILKACIAASTVSDELPADRSEFRSLYTHNLNTLLLLTGREKQFYAAMANNPVLSANWSVVKDWSEQWRYNLAPKSQQSAQDLIRAISDPKDGLAKWFSQFC